MEYSSAIYFIKKFAIGDYTEGEHQEFISWLNIASPAELDAILDAAVLQRLVAAAAPTGNDDLIRRIEASLDEYEPAVAEIGMGESEDEAGWDGSLSRVESLPRVRRLRRFTIAASIAALLLLLAGAGWWLAGRSHGKTETAYVKPKTDIAPGRDAATLSLSGGRKVELSGSAEDTVLAEGTALIANSDGRLAYNVGNGATGEITYNTLTTQRGNQYQLTLPDGTRVWLNAASSITYPTTFTGASRRVSITGEAYFEVVKNLSQPFHVRADSLDITVLGTSFNINTYRDEPVSRTTLVEGSVRVGSGPAVQILRPGQQARVSDGRIQLVASADIEQALAWKQGLVKLTGANIREVMRQVSRWYDVDVEYQGNLDNAVFVGVVSRQQNLGKFLELLEATGSVHCTLDNNKIIIKP